jgi:hypothetical protein
LARFGGFAELKRSLRERPQLQVFGISTDDVGMVEDWHGGSRRQTHERGVAGKPQALPDAVVTQ